MEDDKIIDLEMTLAHQDKVIADLSDVVNAQWKEIETLKRQLSKTNSKIEELGSAIGGEDQANVKPPHW